MENENKVRKVFLEDLPRRGKTIDWKSSVGRKVNFTYNGLKGAIEIIKVTRENKKTLLTIGYKNKEIEIVSQQFKDGGIGQLLGDECIDYKYSINQIITTNTGDIKILEQTKPINNSDVKKRRKGYIYECLKCGYIGNIEEYRLINDKGCPVCSNRKIIKGINDIATTHPHLTKYFANIEDAYTHSYGYDGKVLLKCPDCGNERKQAMNILTSQYKNGFTCSNCGDGFSYPEKFVNNVLKQLNIKFNTQKTFDWSKDIKHGNKIYDFYIPSLNCIIETHGEQHYRKGFHTQFQGRTLEEEQANDKLKENLALKNKIKKENYIIIDCRHTQFQWMKEHIINSNLSKLFDLSHIDWMECGRYASTSLIKIASEIWNEKTQSIKKIAKIVGVDRHTVQGYLKQASLLGFCNYKTRYEIKKENMVKTCELWNNDTRSTSEIAQKLQINIVTVRRYLNELSKLGFCDYNGEEEGLKMRVLNSKLKRKSIICIETQQIFHSANEIEEKSLELFNVNLQASSIRKTCTGKFKRYKGFTFRYIDEDKELNK